MIIALGAAMSACSHYDAVSRLPTDAEEAHLWEIADIMARDVEFSAALSASIDPDILRTNPNRVKDAIIHAPDVLRQHLRDGMIEIISPKPGEDLDILGEAGGYATKSLSDDSIRFRGYIAQDDPTMYSDPVRVARHEILHYALGAHTFYIPDDQIVFDEYIRDKSIQAHDPVYIVDYCVTEFAKIYGILTHPNHFNDLQSVDVKIRISQLQAIQQIPQDVWANDVYNQMMSLQTGVSTIEEEDALTKRVLLPGSQEIFMPFGVMPQEVAEVFYAQRGAIYEKLQDNIRREIQALELEALKEQGENDSSSDGVEDTAADQGTTDTGSEGEHSRARSRRPR